VIAGAALTGRSTVRTNLRGNLRGESVKIMLRAAIAILSLGIGSADAGDGDGNSVTTLFTSIRAATPARSVAAEPPTSAAQNGGTAVQAPDARSQGQGSWLFRVFSLP
jgi:hypothetical protein